MKKKLQLEIEKWKKSSALNIVWTLCNIRTVWIIHIWMTKTTKCRNLPLLLKELMALEKGWKRKQMHLKLKYYSTVFTHHLCTLLPRNNECQIKLLTKVQYTKLESQMWCHIPIPREGIMMSSTITILTSVTCMENVKIASLGKNHFFRSVLNSHLLLQLIYFKLFHFCRIWFKFVFTR